MLIYWPTEMVAMAIAMPKIAVMPTSSQSLSVYHLLLFKSSNWNSIIAKKEIIMYSIIVLKYTYWIIRGHGNDE